MEQEEGCLQAEINEICLKEEILKSKTADIDEQIREVKRNLLRTYRLDWNGLLIMISIVLLEREQKIEFYIQVFLLLNIRLNDIVVFVHFFMNVLTVFNKTRLGMSGFG